MPVLKLALPDDPDVEFPENTDTAPLVPAVLTAPDCTLTTPDVALAVVPDAMLIPPLAVVLVALPVRSCACVDPVPVAVIVTVPLDTGATVKFPLASMTNVFVPAWSLSVMACDEAGCAVIAPTEVTANLVVPFCCRATWPLVAPP